MAGTLSATIAIGQAVNAAHAGNGALAAQIIERYAATAGLTGAGALDVASALPRFDRSAALTGGSTLVCTPKQIYQYIANLLGGGGLSGDTKPTATRTADLLGAGTLSGTVVLGQQHLSDTFNRANSTTGLGANWVPRYGVMGINTNRAYPVSSSFVTYVDAMSTNDIEVSITMAAPGSGSTAIFFGVGLGFNNSGEGVFARFGGGSANGDVLIVSTTDFGVATSTVRVQKLGGVGYAAGNVLSVRRVGNVYTIRKNGTPISGAAWTDSANVVPRDANHRLVSLSANKGTLTNDWAYIDTWAADDL